MAHPAVHTTYTRIDENGHKVWTYNNANGSYPSGISTDANFAYLLAYRGNRIDVVNKNTGVFVTSITLPGTVSIHGEDWSSQMNIFI